MDQHPVGAFTDDARHLMPHAGEIDGRIVVLHRPRAPHVRQQREVVERAVVIELFLAPESAIDGPHGVHVLAHPRSGMAELRRVAPLDVGAHLGAQPHRETTTGRLSQHPRCLRGEHRAARKRDRDARAEAHVRRGESSRGAEREHGLRTFRDPQRVEPCGTDPLRDLLHVSRVARAAERGDTRWRRGARGIAHASRPFQRIFESAAARSDGRKSPPVVYATGSSAT